MARTASVTQYAFTARPLTSRPNLLRGNSSTRNVIALISVRLCSRSRMREVTVNGIEEVKQAIDAASGRIFILFTGSKIDGKTEPVVESVVHSDEGRTLDATFITCFVGARDYWKSPTCPFRTDPAFKLNCVPTLVEYGKKHKRLTEGQLTNADLLKDFFVDS
ncbi:unnamed protein product [Nippostrongylus brasiliensis]|uniref:DUF953 domain-containing protein n=1 Tax=Nippostrongylus brasiliensis TaxID=27835 RepID=A0A158R1B5_NIPBR|nr:unnamed protein product [Nippostrongylus brasiliensis]